MDDYEQDFEDSVDLPYEELDNDTYRLSQSSAINSISQSSAKFEMGHKDDNIGRTEIFKLPGQRYSAGPKEISEEPANAAEEKGGQKAARAKRYAEAQEAKLKARQDKAEAALKRLVVNRPVSAALDRGKANAKLRPTSAKVQIEAKAVPRNKNYNLHSNQLAKALFKSASSTIPQPIFAAEASSKATNEGNPNARKALRKMVPSTKSQQISKKTEAIFQVEANSAATNEMNPGGGHVKPVPGLQLAKLFEKSTNSTSNAGCEKFLSAIVKKKLDPNFKAQQEAEKLKQMEDHKKALQSLKQVKAESMTKVEDQRKHLIDREKELLKREKEFKAQSPTKEVRARRKTTPPKAPQPKALAENCYKLHQLAESIPMKGQHRMTASSLSSDLLTAIRTLSVMLSEELTEPEIKAELTRVAKIDRLLNTKPTDCDRGDIDWYATIRRLGNSYQTALNSYMDTLAQIAADVQGNTLLQRKVAAVEPTKAVIKLPNGKFMRAGMLPDDVLLMQIEELVKNSPNILREDPVDVVVYKLEQQGYTLDALFSKIDSDGDRVLTMTEIKAGFADLDLLPEEHQVLMKKLDENSDGVVTLAEFMSLLDPKLRVQKEYRALIGNLDIQNPIVFEEEILHMRFKGRQLLDEVPDLAKALGERLPDERSLVTRVKELERLLEDRKVKREVDSGLLPQLEVEVATSSARLQNIRTSVNDRVSNRQAEVTRLAQHVSSKVASTSQLASGVVKTKYLQDISNSKAAQLGKIEEKLDKANSIIAAVMIQTMIKRFIARRKYRLERLKVKKSVRVISSAFSRFKSRKAAAIKIQSRVRQINAKAEVRRRRAERPPPPKQLNESSIMAESEQGGVMDDSMVADTKRTLDSFVSVACDICNLAADCLCTECRSYFCQTCFTAQHRLRKHKSYLLNTTLESNASESGTLLTIKSRMEAQHIDFVEMLRMRDMENLGQISWDDYEVTLTMPILELDEEENRVMMALGRRYEVEGWVNYMSLAQVF